MSPYIYIYIRRSAYLKPCLTRTKKIWLSFWPFQTSLWLWRESKTTKTGLSGAHLSHLSGKSERLHLHCWLHTFHGSKTPFPCPPPRKQQHIHLFSMVLRKKKRKKKKREKVNSTQLAAIILLLTLHVTLLHLGSLSWKIFSWRKGKEKRMSTCENQLLSAAIKAESPLPPLCIYPQSLAKSKSFNTH